MSYDSLQVYGLGIEADEQRILGLSIETAESRMLGLHIDANNFFQGDIQVTDVSGTNVSGASVSITGNGTNLSGTTNSEGIYNVDGIEVINTNLSIQADGFHAYQGPMPTSLTGEGITIVLSPPTGSGSTSKKVYITNKGNTLINPNDTILIELD